MISARVKDFICTISMMSASVLLVLGLVSCGGVDGHSASEIKVPTIVQKLPDMHGSLPITIQDLSALAVALESFKRDHRRYPINFPKGTRGWEGLYSEDGKKAKWLNDIFPTYLKSIPMDPKKDAGNKAHYLYASDGANYKLIIFQIDNCEAIKREYSIFADPLRDCRAYGIWTHRAADW